MNPQFLEAALRHEGGLSRRLFLAYAAALAGIPALAQQAGSGERRPGFSDDPFTLGVASGDPNASGMVLWTRLAPRPLEPDGGMPAAAVEVRWEVAEDEGMRSMVQSGVLPATPLLGHSVHVEVGQLKPDRWYWYRFHAGGATSPIGRTRTLPEPGAHPERLRFAVASCQHYEAGFFSAYEQMAKEELDFVLHLGDYIYEGAGARTGVRTHAGGRLLTLEDYRIRHSQYRADPLLQAMHARCPWFVTWDDHEVENNYAGTVSGRRHTDPAAFLAQRAAAYQAYYEMMPLRRKSLPRGSDMLLYRKASFGQLAELLLLDTRQYRSDQPNKGRRSDLNRAAFASRGTLLGADQKKWLQESLVESPATWNVLAQQVMMGMIDHVPGDEHGYSMDQWPGYARERMELVRYLSDRRIANPVVLTGDIHSNWVNDLRVDDRRPEMPLVATEFVGTSITSGGNGKAKVKAMGTLLAENAGLRFHNRQRGYVRCTVTPGLWRSDFMVTREVQKPGGQTSLLASFVVEAGNPGARPG